MERTNIILEPGDYFTLTLAVRYQVQHRADSGRLHQRIVYFEADSLGCIHANFTNGVIHKSVPVLSNDNIQPWINNWITNGTLP